MAVFWRGRLALKDRGLGRLLAGVLPALLLAAAGGAAYLDRLPAALGLWTGVDKLLHFLLYGLWAAGLESGLGGASLRLGRSRLPAALALPALASLADELLQSRVPHRNVEVLDVLFSWAGLVLFWGLVTYWRRRGTR
jgi:VanZ family protein